MECKGGQGLDISALGVTEVRWTGSGEVKFLYSGNRHERGVGVMLAELLVASFQC